MKSSLKRARPLAAAIGVAALMGAMPSYAADVIGEEPPAPAAPMEQPPLNTWSGPYAGVSIGYGFAGHADGTVGGDVEDRDGFIASGFVGYNYQVGQIVAGVEGDLGYAGLRGDNGVTEARSDLDGSLRARLGYAVTDDILLYTTAGGAGQSLEVSEGGVSDSKTQLGWTVGAGTDVKITDNMFGRVEYRYSDFGSDTFNTASGASDIDSRDHRVTFGVGMKF